jgi:hypothetical protein
MVASAVAALRVCPGGRAYDTAWNGTFDSGFVYDRLDQVSVLYMQTHAGPNTQCLVQWSNENCIRGQTVGETPPDNDPTNGIYYIERLPPGSLAHCRFAFFSGCHTAEPTESGASLLNAALDQGADLAAGFRDFAYGTPPAITFFDKFWYRATSGRMSVLRAARIAIWETREQYRMDNDWRDNPTGGTETFMVSPNGSHCDIHSVRWGD